jgi:sensor c-di-GMP phosphodiesterase-like protein
MKSGDAVAAQQIWGRYYQQLVQFAERRMSGKPGLVRWTGEDFAHSAFRRAAALR